MSRVGAILLDGVSLSELIAVDAEEYMAIVAKLAADILSIPALHATLRERMRSSPVTDAPRLARNVEAAFQQMWMTWSGKPCSTARP